MACQADGADGVRYVSHRTHRGEPPADFAARYRPTGPVFSAQPGSLEYFLTARYCLYAGDAAGREDRGRVYRGEVDHADWPLQPAEAEIEHNTVLAPLALPLSRRPAAPLIRPAGSMW